MSLMTQFMGILAHAISWEGVSSLRVRPRFSYLLPWACHPRGGKIFIDLIHIIYDFIDFNKISTSTYAFILKS